MHGQFGASPGRRYGDEVAVAVSGPEVTVAGQTLVASAIRSVAVVHRPGRTLITWGPAVVAGLVAAIAAYVVLSRLVGAVLSGFAAHPVGVLLFLALAIFAGAVVALAVRRYSARVVAPAYQLRVDVDGVVRVLAESRDFATLKRAEAQILTVLGS